MLLNVNQLICIEFDWKILREFLACPQTEGEEGTAVKEEEWRQSTFCKLVIGAEILRLDAPSCQYLCKRHSLELITPFYVCFKTSVPIILFHLCFCYNIWSLNWTVL